MLARHRTPALALAGVLALVALVLTLTGVVKIPSVEPLLADFADSLGAWTYVLVAAMAFLETGAFVGFIAPGETVIVLGGVVSAEGETNIVAMLLVAWLFALLGDVASFLLGRKLGRRFLLKHGRRFAITPERVARVDAFYARHGAKAVLTGRFVGIIRAVSPFLAGASGLRPRVFVFFSLIGTLVWASLYTLMGYLLNSAGEATDLLAKLTLGAFVVGVAAYFIARRSGQRRTPASRPAR
ncbi:DedA family protein [Solirubrobacter sp. CPCC 204708]|uniref:DedA family protein n=1 Tax=Solirubrobacter deserti TaxID=2282478 RepID=A0ABT4RRL1_9ACTN|nr:DedA family protein [Solirubrobacter deserti]MBE2314868.1 DedA family protein [Solirubrobacter deserti]MDA0141095.1 DedA family protein [Solirubrobacter deserti]